MLGDPAVADDVDAVMRAARVISAIIAESIAQADDAVTLPPLRTLVLVATRPDVDASAVAASLDIHLSNASRLCDRLMQTGLPARQQSTVDRRNLVLSLTPAGSGLLSSVMEHRRTPSPKFSWPCRRRTAPLSQRRWRSSPKPPASLPSGASSCLETRAKQHATIPAHGLRLIIRFAPGPRA